LRPDRDIIDLNAWEPFDSDRLEVINRSKALILMGGPALQKNMRPKIYPLCDRPQDIHTPDSHDGNWLEVNTWNLG